jgi:uncharacterized protein (DUF1330 family)
MTAYVIAQVDVTDPEKFEQYRALVPATLKKYGGEYIVRGGEMAVLEGDMPFPRVVVIRFDDMAAAKRWYESEEYAGPIAMRKASTKSLLVAVDGYDG